MDYQPINCNYYDELEALATLRRDCEVIYLDAGTHKTVKGKIVDLWNQEKVEYLRMSSGEVIRLDLLVSVDGKVPANYC